MQNLVQFSVVKARVGTVSDMDNWGITPCSSINLGLDTCLEIFLKYPEAIV